MVLRNEYLDVSISVKLIGLFVGRLWRACRGKMEVARHQRDVCSSAFVGGKSYVLNSVRHCVHGGEVITSSYCLCVMLIHCWTMSQDVMTYKMKWFTMQLNNIGGLKIVGM